MEGKLEAPKNLARTVHDLYFEPRYEDFRARTIWSLSNAFTSAFKELDPIPQFKTTAKLGEFLEARFSQSFWVTGRSGRPPLITIDHHCSCWRSKPIESPRTSPRHCYRICRNSFSRCRGERNHEVIHGHSLLLRVDSDAEESRFLIVV